MSVRYLFASNLATTQEAFAIPEANLSNIKLQSALDAVPFLKHMEILVDTARPGSVVLTLAGTGTLNDHVGHVHSGALFSLGEAAAGIAVGTHTDLNALVTRQQASGIRYLRPCPTQPKAYAEVSVDMMNQIREALSGEGEAKVELVVPIKDSTGSICAEVVSVFTFRQPES